MGNALVFLLKNFIIICNLDTLRSYERGKCHGAKFHEIKSLDNFDFCFRFPMDIYSFKIEKKSSKIFLRNS